MERQRIYEFWSGLAMLVVAFAVAAPVLFGAIDPAIDRILWTSLFVVFLLSVGTAFSPLGRRAGLTGFAAAVGISWVLVLTAPGMGLLNILLVVTAAVSAYLLPLGWGLVLVGLNTVVLAADTVRAEPPVLDAVLVLGFYLLIQAATLLSTHALIREQQQRRELARAHVDLRAASALLSVNARAAERLRISRDLHDTIGHQLTVLALELEAAQHRGPERSREHVVRAAGVARDLLDDVRTTVGELRLEPTDLATALEQVVDGLPGLDVHLEVEPGLRVDEERTEALVRAVQEIVTNTLRHAGATRLWITVSGSGEGRDRQVVLLAEDDGHGARGRGGAGGHGLRGIAERFEALGGQAEFDVGSRRADGTGFGVRARVPGP